MSFGNTFDAYCVVHAPFAAPQRRAEFEASLASVGVSNYRVVEAERVAADDPRTKPFGAPGPVSLIDAVVRVIELARAEGWSSVAIFEDDVIFRRRFAARWAQVEQAVRATPWDVLTLYRWPWHNVIIEKPFARTSLLPIRWTLTTHAYAIRASAYDVVLDAIAACLAEGKPLDLFTGKVTRAGGHVFATSHNLAGQTSMSGGSTLGNFRRHPPPRPQVPRRVRLLPQPPRIRRRQQRPRGAARGAAAGASLNAFRAWQPGGLIPMAHHPSARTWRRDGVPAEYFLAITFGTLMASGAVASRGLHDGPRAEPGNKKAAKPWA